MVSENPPPLHPFTGASVVLLLHGGQITGLMKLEMQSAGACWKHAGGSVMLVLPAGPGPEAWTSWVAPTDNTNGELWRNNTAGRITGVAAGTRHPTCSSLRTLPGSTGSGRGL